MEIAQNMESEINRIFELLKKVTHEFVIEKYINRINYFVQQINIKTGNIE